MGSDPEAIIYYGWPLPEEPDDWDAWNGAWRKGAGPEQPEDKSDYKTPEWDAWREQLRQWEQSYGYVRVSWSGADECERYYVVAGPKVTVDWDEQKPLKDHDFGPQPEADEQLRAFCERFGLPTQEAGWHLAARYF